jgi:hypothetical protein
VSEQQDVIADLEAPGVLSGLRWAYTSATSRTLEMYSEPDGHDAALLGSTRFTLFRDRLDRVFSCEKYGLPPGSVGTVSLDLVRAELTEQDVETMPLFAPDLVRRSNLHGSPGWAYGSRRFLLASCAFGKLDQLPWPRKSKTKQQVARQPSPDPSAQATLFDDLADEEVAGLLALANPSEPLDLETFVVGHTLDAMSQAAELILGRPRLNSGGGKAWHWAEDLLTPPTTPGGRVQEGPTAPVAPDTTPDAPVRLRPSAGEQPQAPASGNQ